MSDKHTPQAKMSLLEKWSKPKEQASSFSLAGSLGSSLLTSKSLLTDDALKSKLRLSSPLTASSSSLTSLTSLTSNRSSLLGSSLLKSSLLSTPKVQSDLTKSSFGDKPTLTSSFTQLSLQKSSAISEKGGEIKEKVRDVKRSAPQKRKHVSSSVSIKKKAVDNENKGITAKIIKQYTIQAPNYSIKSDRDEEFTAFTKSEKFSLPGSQNQLVPSIGKSLADINQIKRDFINCVSGSLIAQPDLKNKDDLTRYHLIQHVEKMDTYDPEFILKVALYSRKELNIRTTSNFLLAVAAKMTSSRQYLKKYFSVSINLPSDWIEVAEIFQTLEDSNLKLGSLPAALRKAMIAKFTEFDEYQLAKYNKEKSAKKKKAKDKKMVEASKTKTETKRKFFDSDSSDSEEEDMSPQDQNVWSRQLSKVSFDEKESEEILRKQTFTIKQLIRKLHIREPVQYVMGIIGKKYPMTSEEFYQKRLPGVFDETKAGKRMKLAVPETWETQVSLKGNKAKTWEDLIDHKKLPFMAMLRNLRNLIKAGISNKHHSNVLRRLTDQKQVVNSKQFPFRFFSAYAALNDLEKEYEKNQNEMVETAVSKTQGHLGVRGGGVQRGARGRGRGGAVTTRGGARGAWGGKRGGKRGGGAEQWWLKKKMKKDMKEGAEVKEVKFDKSLIQRYRKALDTAVKIATVHNVYPIKGRTILLCDVGQRMDRPCSSARGLGKPRTLKEISVLMGLMCKYASEDCQFIVFNEMGFQEVELQPGTILDNMDTVLSAQFPNKTKEMVSGVPYGCLLEKLRDRIEVDNLLVFGEDDFYPSAEKGTVINDFLRNYRHMVNPNLLFVSVTFSSPKPGVSLKVQAQHHNDVYVSGYSDALLRFVAERGGEGQVNHVDRIDDAFQLTPLPQTTSPAASKPAVPSQNLQGGEVKVIPFQPSWRTIRVFISSTFRDMHGERDLLTRFIFPELRALARRKFINVYEVDLRWGITEEESKDNRALEMCLREVSRCHLFVGLLGERYGWTPDLNQVPSGSEFDWVRTYPSGASVTELEMYLGALSKPQEAKDTAFFFIRDSTFEKDVPAALLHDFKAETETHQNKLSALKQRILKSGLEVYDRYPCHWGGFVSDKPIVAGLEDFGARLLNSLVNAVEKLCPEEEQQVSEEEQSSNAQWAFVESLTSEFVGRKGLVGKITSAILNTPAGLIGLVGKMGCGKTSLMASTIQQFIQLKQVGGAYTVFFNFANSAPGSGNLVATMRRLAQQINARFCLGRTLPDDFKNLSGALHSLIEDAASVCPTRFVLFLDGIDVMDSDHQPFNLEWLPSPAPQNVVFVINAVEGGLTHKALKRLNAQEIELPGLDTWDKAELVRTTLAKHSKSLNESGFGNQMKLLLLKKEASNPLYLRLACEELRVFGVFEKITEKLWQLPHTTAQMLQEILTRLEEDHGEELVCWALSLLVSVRDGLYPEELYELLNWMKAFGPAQITTDTVSRCDLDLSQTLAPLTFTFLVRSITCFLNPSMAWSPMLAVTNREVQNAIRLRYMKSSDSSLELALHKLLAGFFWKQADISKNGSWKGSNSRAFMELPYHLAAGNQLTDLKAILCDHSFIHAKCQLGLAARLLEDYNPQAMPGRKIQEKNLSNFSNLPHVREYKSFVSRNIEVLSRYPTLGWQQALNEPSASYPYKDAASKLSCVSDLLPYMEWSNKPEEASECILTLSNFKLPVTSLCISPCGTLFATGCKDTLVRMYNVKTGKELFSFTGHSDVITDVCFVGTNMLCSASADNTLSVWDVTNLHRIQTLKGHSRRVNSCASDRQGKFIASGGWDCTVFVWKATSPFAKQCTFDVGSPVNNVAFHPSLEQIIVGSWDSIIRIYNYLYETRIAVLRGHSASVRDLAYSGDGLHLASAAMDGDIKIWAADKGSQVGNIRGHSGPINKLTFSPTGRELITAGEDRQIKVWSGELGVPLHRIESEKLGAATSVSISPTGLTLAVGYHLGYVVVHDVNTGAKLFKVRLGSNSVGALTFSPDGEHLLAGCSDATVQILQSTQGSKVCLLVGPVGPVHCVTVSKNHVAVGGENFTCCLYENIQVLKKSRQAGHSAMLKGHLGPVTSCCFSPDETMLATASRDASIRIYQVRDAFLSDDPQPTQIISDCHADWINSCQWSNLGPFLVTASNDFNLKLFDVRSGAEKLTITGHSSAVNTVAYKYGCIVSGSSDGTLRVFSHKGTAITALHGHSLRVNACDMFVKCKNKEGEEEEESESWADMMEVEGQQTKPARKKDLNLQDVIVASAGDDGDVWVWRPLQANNLSTLSAHGDRVLSVAVSQEKQFVSCSLDRTVRLWQPELSIFATGMDSGQLTPVNSPKHDAPVTFVAVSANGNIAVSGSRDGILKVWSKNEDNMFEMRTSFPAHEKSVNCAAFIGSSSKAFVTGGDDNLLLSWEIMETKKGFYLRKRHTMKLSLPIECVLPVSDSVTCVSTWDGRVWTCGTGAPKQIHSVNQSRGGSSAQDAKNWVSSLFRPRDTEGESLIFGTTEGQVGHLTLNLQENIDCAASSSLQIEAPTQAEETGYKYRPAPTSVLALVSAEKKNESKLLAGDSYGRLSFIGDGRAENMQIHDAAVTAMEIVEDTLFTGSADGTVKVWFVCSLQTPELKQIGQFFCSSHVTSLKVSKVIYASNNSRNINLLVGDLLGNIYQLSWHAETLSWGGQPPSAWTTRKATQS